MFAGGIVIGWARYSRVPGPYLVVADERSVEPEGIAAAQWVSHHLVVRNRIVIDRANGLLMGSIGGQDPIGGDFLGRSVPDVLTTMEFNGTVYYVLLKDHVDYVIADRRLSTALPLVGVYIESDEPGAYEHVHPPSVGALLKYDGICPIPLEFDSGNILIFDTRNLDRSYCLAATTGRHHYERFPTAPVRFGSMSLNERAVVEQFDVLMQNPVRNAATLFVLKQDIRFLRNRVSVLASSTKPASWKLFWRAWRWQELDNRLL
jgi:hypothetical protein